MRDRTILPKWNDSLETLTQIALGKPLIQLQPLCMRLTTHATNLIGQIAHLNSFNNSNSIASHVTDKISCPGDCVFMSASELIPSLPRPFKHQPRLQGSL
jgi:hypothetical protein